jgi:hypothetical protein
MDHQKAATSIQREEVELEREQTVFLEEDLAPTLELQRVFLEQEDIEAKAETS